VWKAWLWDEWTPPQQQRHVYIVKGSWRDDERHPEGEFYKTDRADGIAVMRSFGAVRTNGQVDDIFVRFRCSLQVEGKPSCIDMPQRNIDLGTLLGKIFVRGPNRDRELLALFTRRLDCLPLIAGPVKTPRGRTHSRLVMESYGGSIKYAVTLLELVGAMHDALAGHRIAFENGVVHHDLSPENILISRETAKGRHGIVIDLDFAKMLDDKTTATDPPCGTRPYVWRAPRENLVCACLRCDVGLGPRACCRGSSPIFILS